MVSRITTWFQGRRPRSRVTLNLQLCCFISCICDDLTCLLWQNISASHMALTREGMLENRGCDQPLKTKSTHSLRHLTAPPSHTTKHPSPTTQRHDLPLRTSGPDALAISYLPYLLPLSSRSYCCPLPSRCHPYLATFNLLLKP